MAEKYKMLLSPVKVGNVVLKNRLINSPANIHFVQGDEPWPTPESIQWYAEKARDGCALINVGNVAVGRGDGKNHGYGWDMTDSFAQNYIGQLTEAIHFFGSKCDVFFKYNLNEMFPGTDISDGIANVHVVKGITPGQKVVAATEEQLIAFAEDFTDKVSILQKECGFDGVFLHMAYRASCFGRALSPLTNKREDRFGGTLEKRCAYAILVTDLIRKKCGKNFIIEGTIGPDPDGSGGTTLEDLCKIAGVLDGHFDILTPKDANIDPSHATPFQGRTPLLYMAEALKKSVKKTLITCSGGMSNPAFDEQLLEEGRLDLISNARAWIADPEFATKIYEDRADEIIPCQRCNKCHKAGTTSVWAPYCAVNPRFGWDSKLAALVDIVPTRHKKIAVIGGGPAGMKAALTAKERGHDVTLYEKTTELGGQLKITKNVPFKYPLQDLRKTLIHLVEKKEITVHLNCEPTVEQLNAEGYDAIIAATGAQPAVPPIPGATSDYVLQALDVLQNPSIAKGKTVIIGGGEIGTELAIYLAENADLEVSIIEMKDKLAAESVRAHYYDVFKACWESKSNIHPILNAACTGISEGKVSYRDANGEHTIEADTVILSSGMKPNQDDALVYAEANGRFYMAGDCDKVGNIQTAFRVAYATAYTM